MLSCPATRHHQSDNENDLLHKQASILQQLLYSAMSEQCQSTIYLTIYTTADNKINNCYVIITYQ